MHEREVKEGMTGQSFGLNGLDQAELGGGGSQGGGSKLGYQPGRLRLGGTEEGTVTVHQNLGCPEHFLLLRQSAPTLFDIYAFFLQHFEDSSKSLTAHSIHCKNILRH